MRLQRVALFIGLVLMIVALTPTYAQTPPPEPPKPFNPAAIQFVLHRGNANYLSGKRQYPTLRHKGLGAWQILAIALLCAVVALVALLIYRNVRADYLELRDAGVMVEGEIVDGRQTTDTRNRSHTYYLTYRYEWEDRLYQHEQTVPLGVFKALKVGDSVGLRVSRLNPTLVRLEGTNKLNDAAAYIAAGFGIGALALNVRGILQNQRDQSYARRGKLVEGLVRSSYAEYRLKGRNRVFYAKIAVTFPSPQDYWTVAGAVESNYAVLKKHLPAEGTPIAIFFVDEAHWWML